jgi:hypothetical protein
VALEPGRLQRARRHAAGHDNLEGALAEAQLWWAGMHRRVLQQAIESVGVPVEFLLQRDAADAVLA